MQLAAAKGNKKNANVTASGCTVPIVMKILPTSVAKVTATPKGNLKAGMNGEIIVKVDRQFDYTGEFKVKIVLPANAKGVTIDDATIPAGKDEIVIPVKVAADAPAATLQNLNVQATAMVEGKVPILHEVKFNVTVEKAPEVKKDVKKDKK